MKNPQKNLEVSVNYRIERRRYNNDNLEIFEIFRRRGRKINFRNNEVLD